MEAAAVRDRAVGCRCFMMLISCGHVTPLLCRMEDAYQAALAKAGGLGVAKPKAVRLF